MWTMDAQVQVGFPMFLCKHCISYRHQIVYLYYFYSRVSVRRFGTKRNYVVHERLGRNAETVIDFQHKLCWERPRQRDPLSVYPISWPVAVSLVSWRLQTTTISCASPTHLEAACRRWRRLQRRSAPQHTDGAPRAGDARTAASRRRLSSGPIQCAPGPRTTSQSQCLATEL